MAFTHDLKLRLLNSALVTLRESGDIAGVSSTTLTASASECDELMSIAKGLHSLSLRLTMVYMGCEKTEGKE